jgi:hypothetical protein
MQPIDLVVIARNPKGDEAISHKYGEFASLSLAKTFFNVYFPKQPGRLTFREIKG